MNIPSLQFLGIGSPYATTVTVTQAGYSGQFVLGGTSCSGIAASDTPMSAANFTITPLAVGACDYTLIGGGNAQTTLPVTVTVTTVVGQ